MAVCEIVRMTPSNRDFSLQTFGLFQLENLRRQQTKFFLVALRGENPSEGDSRIPNHALLKIDLTFEIAEAAEKIVDLVRAQAIPLWWPFVLISVDGKADFSVAEKLASDGLMNVYSYRGGWKGFVDETKIPSSEIN